MTELRKTGTNEYDVVADGRVIGRVWDWQGKWSSESDGEAYHGPHSRKEALLFLSAL
jgi:hypothetical protein